jgi:hypothetical protein
MVVRLCDCIIDSPVTSKKAEDDATEVSALELGVEEREDIVIYRAEGRFRLLAKAIVEGVNDLLLEVIAAGMGRDHRFALSIRHIEVAHAQDVHFDARRDEGDFGFLVLRNARRGVQRDGVSDDVCRAIDCFSYDKRGGVRWTILAG